MGHSLKQGKISIFVLYSRRVFPARVAAQAQSRGQSFKALVTRLQVGQELEDVLTERDALKAVNQALAKRTMGPHGPCPRCQEVASQCITCSHILLPKHSSWIPLSGWPWLSTFSRHVKPDSLQPPTES